MRSGCWWLIFQFVDRHFRIGVYGWINVYHSGSSNRHDHWPSVWLFVSIIHDDAFHRFFWYWSFYFLQNIPISPPSFSKQFGWVLQSSPLAKKSRVVRWDSSVKRHEGTDGWSNWVWTRPRVTKQHRLSSPGVSCLVAYPQMPSWSLLQQRHSG